MDFSSHALRFKHVSVLLLMLPLTNALQQPAKKGVGWTRRHFVATATAAAVVFPQKSNAVEPLTEKDVSRIKDKMNSAKFPGDKVQRQPLALDFAVLLTRSSYVETDQLDVIPINQLERDMYLVRTAEYETYLQKIGGSMAQGDLTDPKYFDYMSGVQYFVINRAIQNPETEFEETKPEASEMPDGSVPKLKKVRVQRELPNDKLVSTFNERVGTSILDYFYNTYRGTPIALQEYGGRTSDLSRPGIDKVHETLKQLVKTFLINGFAWEGQADLIKRYSDDSASFVLSLTAPATLWSGQALAKQNAPVRNDFLLKTAKQLVQAMGYSVTASSVKFEGENELSILTIV